VIVNIYWPLSLCTIIQQTIESATFYRVN
jgi:hypothetical protein